MRRLTMLLLATWLLIQPAALAFDMRHGDEVVIPAGTTVADDLYVAGGKVQVDGTILGDLVVAGGEVTVTGDVRQDLIAAGGKVDMRGRVGQSVRALGGNLRLAGTVGKDALLAGGDLHQEADCRVAGDGAYAGGQLDLGGTVGKKAMVAGGDVTLRGRMGPTTAYIGDLQLTSEARINGPLAYTSEATADIAPGAVITGGVTHHVPPVQHRRIPGPHWGWWVALLVASLLSGAFLLLVLPKAAERVVEEVEGQPLLALLIGFALVVGTPIALVLLMITVVGIPLALALLGLYMVAWHVGWLAAGLALGDAILRRWTTLPSRMQRLLAALAIGIPLVLIVQFLPFIGWLIAFLAVCVGFGGMALAIAHSQGRGSRPPVEPLTPLPGTDTP